MSSLGSASTPASPRIASRVENGGKPSITINTNFNYSNDARTRRTSDSVSPSRPFSMPSASAHSPTSSISTVSSPKAGSKQHFFSLFKKKDNLQNNVLIPPSRASTMLQPQNLEAALQYMEENDQTTASSRKPFATPYSISQRKLASVSVPNLLALNSEALQESSIDQQQSIIGGESTAQTLPKRNKRKGSAVSFEKSDDKEKGFKETMKNTMRKTSTFFKKLGSKQHLDNVSHQSNRPPLPNFTGNPNNGQTEQIPTLYFDTFETSNDTPNSDAGLSEEEFDSSDEQENLQRALQDYASIFEKLQPDSDNPHTLYMNPNKSVPENVGRTDAFFKDENPDNYDTDFLDQKHKRASRNAVFSFPAGTRSERKGLQTNMATFGLTDVKEESGDDGSGHPLMKPLPPLNKARDQKLSKSDEDTQNVPLGTLQQTKPTAAEKNKKSTLNNSKSLPSIPVAGVDENKSTSSLSTPSSLMMGVEEYGMLRSPPPTSERKSAASSNSSHSIKEKEELVLNKGSSVATIEEKGTLKTKRHDIAETSTESGSLSPTAVPKRPDKKLPDIPKTEQISDPSAPRSPHMRQASSVASSYETASGSTATLHTAPPSPITSDTFVENNNNSLPDSPPQIQVGENTIGEIFGGQSIPEVPEKDVDEIARIQAKRCYEEDETFLTKKSIAEYLGGNKPENARVLKCYMEYYDFSNLRLDYAFRRLCARLYIKGETQQVDRILEAFSNRYWECNPKAVFGSADVVHAISYSMLLLNTDLHVAQVSSKMSRAQFVRNTVAAVHAQTTSSNNSSAIEPFEDDQCTIASVDTNTTVRTSTTARPRRSDSINSWGSNPNNSMTNVSLLNVVQGSGYSRQWDSELELLLKEIYSSIKANQILQPLPSSTDKTTESSHVLTLKRSLSHLGHNPRFKLNPSTINRRQKGGRNSPAPSLGSGGSDISIGFDSVNRNSSQTLATTISNNTLRHQSSDDVLENRPDGDMEKDEADSASIADSVSTTESLALYLSGAPYIKEGNLVRKHYWESTGKRARDKTWKECFVAIESGDIKMYKFDNHSTGSSSGGGAVGGGNWVANATLLGEVNLRHTITNALPPPGYNRDRPHVFALSLTNGGLYFFQAGTAELVEEWVATCNYWAAMMSKEPLTGGVSNMEYGWGRCIEQYLYEGEGSEDGHSLMSDGRSVMSGTSNFISDRVVINEWKVPIPPMMSSTLKEEKQLNALKKYVTDLENELEKHNSYREPMTKMFHPRSSNYTKAFSNWEKKSQWLLYEMVKYTTYIECIEKSMKIRAEERKERERAKGINSDNTDHNGTSAIPTITTTMSEEERKKEKKRQEFRARARQSLRLLHRATWTPGDGFALNLPKELFGDDDDLSDMGDEENDEGTISETNSRPVIVEEERMIGDVSEVHLSSERWVDRFAS